MGLPGERASLAALHLDYQRKLSATGETQSAAHPAGRLPCHAIYSAPAKSEDIHHPLASTALNPNCHRVPMF